MFFYGSAYESCIALTNLFNCNWNLSTAKQAQKWLKYWLFRKNRDAFHHFGVNIKNLSEITLPSPKNAIQLNSGRFRAILRYSSDCIILHLQMG